MLEKLNGYLTLPMSIALSGCLGGGGGSESSGEDKDTEGPFVTAFTMKSSPTGLTVSVIALTASDNVGVTGYSITSSDVPPSMYGSDWKTSSPISFTFPSACPQTAYARAPDASGNVSANQIVQVTITRASAIEYSGTWIGNFSSMPLTYLITQNKPIQGRSVAPPMSFQRPITQLQRLHSRSSTATRCVLCKTVSRPSRSIQFIALFR